MVDTIRAKVSLNRGIATVRVIFEHPMETGRRRDAANEVIPAHYITKVECSYKGQCVLRAEWSTGISRNPPLVFKIAGVHRGERIDISWVDNQGASDSRVVALT